MEAAELGAEEAPLVCAYDKFADHFGFFLPLAGITTVKAIRDNPVDIKAAKRQPEAELTPSSAIRSCFVNLTEDFRSFQFGSRGDMVAT